MCLQARHLIFDFQRQPVKEVCEDFFENPKFDISTHHFSEQNGRDHLYSAGCELLQTGPESCGGVDSII